MKISVSPVRIAATRSFWPDSGCTAAAAIAVDKTTKPAVAYERTLLNVCIMSDSGCAPIVRGSRDEGNLLLINVGAADTDLAFGVHVHRRGLVLDLPGADKDRAFAVPIQI